MDGRSTSKIVGHEPPCPHPSRVVAASDGRGTGSGLLRRSHRLRLSLSSSARNIRSRAFMWGAVGYGFETIWTRPSYRQIWRGWRT